MPDPKKGRRRAMGAPHGPLGQNGAVASATHPEAVRALPPYQAPSEPSAARVDPLAAALTPIPHHPTAFDALVAPYGAYGGASGTAAGGPANYYFTPPAAAASQPGDPGAGFWLPPGLEAGAGGDEEATGGGSGGSQFTIDDDKQRGSHAVDEASVGLTGPEQERAQVEARMAREEARKADVQLEKESEAWLAAHPEAGEGEDEGKGGEEEGVDDSAEGKGKGKGKGPRRSNARELSEQYGRMNEAVGAAVQLQREEAQKRDTAREKDEKDRAQFLALMARSVAADERRVAAEEKEAEAHLLEAQAHLLREQNKRRRLVRGAKAKAKND